MSKKLIIFLIIVLACIFQVSVFPGVFSWNNGPDLLLLLVIYWTIKEGFEGTLGRNILVGVLADLVNFRPVGTYLAIFLLVSFLVSSVSKRFLIVAGIWRVFTLTATIIVATLAERFLLEAIFSIATYFNRSDIGTVPAPFLSLVSLEQIFLNLLFFPLVYFFLKKIERSQLWSGQRQY